MQGERSRYCQLQIVRQRLDPQLETEFAGMLVEDKFMDSPNYVDYLCAVHRYIFSFILPHYLQKNNPNGGCRRELKKEFIYLNFRFTEMK